MKKLWILTIILVFGFIANSCGGEDEKITTTYFTVTFEYDNGSINITQEVAEGEKIIKPTNPIKTWNISGLYEGSYNTIPEYIFNGWFNGNEQWNFNTPIIEDILLKAKWTPPVMNVISLAGIDDILTETVNYIKTNVFDDGYTLLLDINLNTGTQQFGIWTQNHISRLTMLGIGEPRTITHINNNYDEVLFYLQNINLTLGNNIILSGGNSYIDIISLNGNSNLTMLEGSKIINCQLISIWIRDNNDTFTMNGGEFVNTEDDISGIGVVYLNGGGVVNISSNASIFLSGDAKIDTLFLSKNSVVNIDSSWNGFINEINISIMIFNYTNETLEELYSYWDDRVIIKGYTLDISNFTLGNFYIYNKEEYYQQPINETHKLELNNGNNIIKLIKK